MPPNLPKIEAIHDCPFCQGVGYSYAENKWLECEECRRKLGGAKGFHTEIPAVYSAIPTTFPKIQSNP